MAPSRGKGKSRAVGGRPQSTRQKRTSRKAQDAIPEVYQEMLDEDARRSPTIEDSERPLKRRRVAAGVRASPAKSTASSASIASPGGPSTSPMNGSTTGETQKKPLQTVEASSDSGSDDDSDFGFEDVDLDRPAATAASDAEDAIADLSISVDPSTTLKPRPQQARRKPVSNAEKAQHVHPLLSKKALSYLRGKEHYTQFQRDRSFREGLEETCEVFRAHFKVDASGMRRAGPSDIGKEHEIDTDDDTVSRESLVRAAREMEGSQDTGNQLLCALLRSAGVDARLVCSLQTIPLSSAQAKTPTPKKPAKQVIRAMPPYSEPVTSDSNTDDNAVKTSSTIGRVPSARRRLGRPSFKPESSAAASPRAAPLRKKHSVRKLDYPIFWVEAFNVAHQKWTAVDPIVTHTIGKPSKFEPPSSYAQNQMTYVIAFEENGVARDVTRRYTKAFTAKTRRNRVESTEEGTKWLKKALRLFRRRGGALDRDQTEDAELNQREAREGLPSNVQDFKDHPVYALERHLKRHEIIEPKREVGKVNAGTAAKPRMESVYRRSDVLVCRSSDKWYRLGRVVQEGQAPIKHVPARSSRRERSLSLDAEGQEPAGAGMTALYAQYQTEAYVAPPVVQGKIPKNAFGNLDIYGPSMVPPGGTHVRHPLAQQAAKHLRIDYADAVVGFQFKGRHGTAIIQGAVVSTEYAEAVETVIDGLLNEQLEEKSMARSAAALRMWKRFLTGLRIKERVDAYGAEGEGSDVRREIDREVDEQEEIAEAGGFFAEEPAMPTAGRFSLVEMSRATKPTPKRLRKKRKEESESEEAELSVPDSEVEKDSGPVQRSKRVGRKVVREEEEAPEDDDEPSEKADSIAEQDTQMDDDLDGGFLPDEAGIEHGGGGFLPDEAGEEDGGRGFIPQDEPMDDGDGGFIPDPTESEVDHGGGFLPADDESEPSRDRSGVGDEDANSLPFGFMPDIMDDAALEADANMAQSAQQDSPGLVRERTLLAPTDQPPASDHVSNNIVDQPDDPAALDPAVTESLSMHGALPGESSAQQDASPSLQAAESVVAASTRNPQGAADEAQAEVEESDHGSMLSHDPEDEDAEPDWLESD